MIARKEREQAVRSSELIKAKQTQIRDISSLWLAEIIL
jgi:hypothetical protein